MADLRTQTEKFKNENQTQTVQENIEAALKARPNDVLIGIVIDGKEIPIEEEEQFLSRAISEFNSVELNLKSSMELAFEALDSCSGYIDTISDQIRSLTQFYQEGEQQKADATFAEIIDLLDLFVQLIGQIHGTIRSRLGDEFQKSETIKSLEVHLLSVMKGLLPAKEKGDIIMLCDLLEYELIDNLTQWKIKAVPELKQYKEKASLSR